VGAAGTGEKLMPFDSFQDFIIMGGYGLYVWLSFFLSFVVIALVALETAIARKSLRKKSQQLQNRQQRLAKRQRSVSQ
jgi:heme exporter protein D